MMIMESRVSRMEDLLEEEVSEDCLIYLREEESSQGREKAKRSS